MEDNFSNGDYDGQEEYGPVIQVSAEYSYKGAMFQLQHCEAK